MKKRKVDPWFPFWIDKWLFGSTRIELEPDERGVFVDLISLSKKDSGFIRANEGVPYLENQLCGLLNISPELFKRTVKKCIKYGKTEKLKDGTLYMTSYEIYSLSERQERRIESEMAESADTMAEKPDTKNRIDKNRIDKNKKEYTKSQIFLTNLLIEKIKENDPKAKTPKTDTDQYFKWVDSIRLCLDRDERTVDEITRGIMYAQTSDFWKSNILSAAKLRKQMPTLLLQAQREKYDYNQAQVGQSTKKTTLEQDKYYKARQEKEKEIRAKYKKEMSEIRKAGDKEAWDILQEKIAGELREWSMNYKESKGGQG